MFSVFQKSIWVWFIYSCSLHIIFYILDLSKFTFYTFLFHRLILMFLALFGKYLPYSIAFSFDYWLKLFWSFHYLLLLFSSHLIICQRFFYTKILITSQQFFISLYLIIWFSIRFLSTGFIYLLSLTAFS